MTQLRRTPNPRHPPANPPQTPDSTIPSASHRVLHPAPTPRHLQVATHAWQMHALDSNHAQWQRLRDLVHADTATTAVATQCLVPKMAHRASTTASRP